MISAKKMQEIIGSILLLGTIFSAVLVAIGGVLFLMQHGGDSIQSELLKTPTNFPNVHAIWTFALSFSPLGIVELGLLLLVATQMVRIALLCWFYFAISDYKFTAISLFILAMLIYSSFWRS